MPRFDLKATELTDTDVNFVALVKRGANRIPFRITKKDDEPMLDLYKIGRQMFQKADRAPKVVAIVARRRTRTRPLSRRSPRLAACPRPSRSPRTTESRPSP